MNQPTDAAREKMAPVDRIRALEARVFGDPTPLRTPGTVAQMPARPGPSTGMKSSPIK